MKKQLMKKIQKQKAFTLIELLIVISIIALLAGLMLPVYNGVVRKAQRTKILSNAKQIGLALKLYASDNDGSFPSYTLQDGTPTNTQVSNSNTAFAQLFPLYIKNEKLFYIAHSKFTLRQPDNVIDNPPLDTPAKTLQPGENAFAYVLGLNDTSQSDYPLIANGFSDEKSHKYSTDATAYGGVFKGEWSVVIRVDQSGAVLKVDPKTLQVKGGQAGTGQSGKPGVDLFANTDPTNWLGSSDIVVNPTKGTGGAQ